MNDGDIVFVVWVVVVEDAATVAKAPAIVAIDNGEDAGTAPRTEGGGDRSASLLRWLVRWLLDAEEGGAMVAVRKYITSRLFFFKKINTGEIERRDVE